MNHKIVVAILIILGIVGCKVNKNSKPANSIESRNLDEITVNGSKRPIIRPYQPSAQRYVDLEHTVLHLKFDYQHQYVLGKAILTITPFNKPQQFITLDAKMFIIQRVALLKRDTLPLVYTYNDKQLIIDLGKLYTSKDKLKILIEYTARPNEIKDEGSQAISQAKGLYFINPLRNKPNYPRQIWSQGETQSNSGWFPTIDKPNEKMTQEIYLTVDNTDVTLSNGELMYSKSNGDGTRTDYWKQTLPHAPYLAMIAIGEFIETKDYWRDSIEVNYYLEKAYAPYAKMIFGSTPEMMECFSKRLGVDYPWQKFSQIVVRDFVSGAMENTSAVIHFELVQHDSREHLDNPWEDIIAHELFHHWFGDLVTCESWSNIPLNESFATYGEYLWDEYKYGKMQADYNFSSNLTSYLSQASAENKNLIRFHYDQQEEMFDVVSYQKGGRILHMLRNYVGDEAFFESLKRYLKSNQFKTVEIHNLRLAFEEVTGEDLNWFFNQWFLNSGHPKLDVTYNYLNENKGVVVKVIQTQDTINHGVFKLPLNIDLYTQRGVKTHPVIIDKAQWIDTLWSTEKIELTNFDASKQLLADIKETKKISEYYVQLEKTQNYIDVQEACKAIIDQKTDSLSEQLTASINRLVADKFWGTREEGLGLIASLNEQNQLVFEPLLIELAKKDPKASIRSEAITILAGIDGKNQLALFQHGVNDSAYSVVSSSLYAISKIDGALAISLAKPYFSTNNWTMLTCVSTIIGSHGKGDYIGYFEQALPKTGFGLRTNLIQYVQYLKHQDTSIVDKALPFLISNAKDESQSVSSNYIKSLKSLEKFYEEEEKRLKDASVEKGLSIAKKNEFTLYANACKRMKEKILQSIPN